MRDGDLCDRIDWIFIMFFLYIFAIVTRYNMGIYKIQAKNLNLII